MRSEQDTAIEVMMEQLILHSQEDMEHRYAPCCSIWQC